VGIIEQASKRLEELRRSGVELPWSEASEGPGAQQPAALAGSLQGLAAEGPALAVPKGRVDIDLSALSAQGYLVPGAERSRLLDEFRAVKRPLLANAVGSKGRDPVERGNLIMITSSLPGEGKTFTSVNLAISMALELNQSVLLVDADPTRMALAERLGIARGHKGLIDLLLDSGLDLSDVELATNVDNLSYLPAGSQHQLATELFGSQAMASLLVRLAAHAQQRIVVFDAPPLLHAAEARALAPQMGQVVLVVQASGIPRGSVQHALHLLEECPLVLTLLNQARGVVASSPYGYYAY
jgi:exopolysaccharide/PEP-CTERM locus tyrosine autokinase